MLLIMLRALAATLIGRWRHGPARPGWSFRFELFARVLKLNAAAQSKRSIPARRKVDERMATIPREIRRQVQQREVTLGGVRCVVFEPPRAERTLVYLHGGGFIGGSARTHGELISRLALASGARTIAPEYRLAPEHAYPAAHDDVLAVWRALSASGEVVGPVALAGDSAGGTLSIALLAALRDAGEPMPSCAVLLSPWVDMKARDGSMRAHARYDWAEPEDFDEWMRLYAGKADPSLPALSPLHANLAGLPPLLIEVGTAEMLLDQVRAFAAKARESGVDVTFRELPDMVHDSYLLAPYFPDCARAIERLGAYVRETSRYPSAASMAFSSPG